MINERSSTHSGRAIGLALLVSSTLMCQVAWAQGPYIGNGEPFATDTAISTAAMSMAQSQEEKAELQPGEVVILTRFGLWAASLDGEVTIRDQEADVDASFSDLIKNADITLFPGIEVWRDRWGAALNLAYVKLSDDENVALGEIDVTTELFVADLGVFYRLFEIPLSSEAKKAPMLTISPTAGARYTYLSLKINPDFTANEDGSEGWVDPYVGARVTLRATENIWIRTEGTVGGFGVGSDFAWTAGGYVEWQFIKQIALSLGYRAMDWDFEDGDFEWDITMHGPWIGLNLAFF